MKHPLTINNHYLYTPTLLLSFALNLFGQAEKWEFVGPVDSIPITAFYVYPDNTILAGSACRALYQSTDNGDTWDTLYSNLPHSNALEIVEACGYLWVVMADYGPGEKALQRSTDNGKTWDHVNFPTATQTYCLAHIGSRIYVGSNTLVYFTTDTAKTWQKHQPEYINAMIDILEYNDTLYFNSANGIYYSDSLFSFWDWGPGYESINSMVLCRDAIVAGGTPGVFIKPLNDKNWNTVLPNDGYQRVHQINDTLLYAGFMTDLFYSTNSGFSWDKIGNIKELIGNDYYFFDMAATKDYTFACNKKGIYRKNNDTSTQAVSIQNKINGLLFETFHRKNLLTISSRNNQPFFAEAYSVKGQRIFRKYSNITGSITIDTQLFPSGILLIQLHQGKNRQVLSFNLGVINRL